MTAAIFLSGGVGSRHGASTPKQYLPLLGKSLALHSYELLIRSPSIDETIIVCDPAYRHLFPVGRFAMPGKRRQDSLYNGLLQVSQHIDHILIHDASRPLLIEEDLENVIAEGKKYRAAALATPIRETIKKTDDRQIVTQTLDPRNLYQVQTPQVIAKELLFQGFQRAILEEIELIDDVHLAELLNHPVKLVMGSYENIKITTPEDLLFAENILRERAELLQV